MHPQQLFVIIQSNFGLVRPLSDMLSLCTFSLCIDCKHYCPAHVVNVEGAAGSGEFRRSVRLRLVQKWLANI